MHHVFVSHSSKDKAHADLVCAALERGGVKCWIAPRDIAPGAARATSILHAITGSRLMVLIYSDHAQLSKHIRREVERCVHHGIPIIPIRIDSAKPTDDLEYFLSTSHWMNMYPPVDEPLRQLTRTVRTVVGLDEGGDLPPESVTSLPLSQPERPPVPPAPAASANTMPLDPAAMNRVETELARIVGPVAARLVNATAPRAATLKELCLLLLPSIPSTTEREKFLDAFGFRDRPSNSATTHVRAPAQSAFAWDPALLDRARIDLAVYIGPMARLVVASASKRAETAKELCDLLAAEIPTAREREKFRAAAAWAAS